MLRNRVQEKILNRIFITNIAVSCAFVFFQSSGVVNSGFLLAKYAQRMSSHTSKYIQKHLNCVFSSIIIKAENFTVASYYYIRKPTCLMHLSFCCVPMQTTYTEIFTLIMPVLIIQEPFHITVVYIFYLALQASRLLVVSLIL